VDREVRHSRWSPRRWPAGVRIGLAGVGIVMTMLLFVKFIAGTPVRTLRLPLRQVTVVTVEHSIFHDLIPLRTTVVPRETVYVDAIDGGRVDRLQSVGSDKPRCATGCCPISNSNSRICAAT
jgi:HlyD family secretion protein